MRRLVILPVSPWSERARWALDHHRLEYQTVEHRPYLGERRLRKLVGRNGKRATVPVLATGDEVVTETWEIAEYADRHGAASPLIPAAQRAEVRRWNDAADTAMQAGRALITAGMLASPAALDEAAPPAVPRWLRPLMRPISRRAMRWFGRKYQLDLSDLAPALAGMRSALELCRRSLDGRDHLLGDFSYADIAMASCLQGVLPVADQYLPLGPAARQVWTQPVLAHEFADLVAWRDRLYQRHRRP